MFSAPSIRQAVFVCHAAVYLFLLSECMWSEDCKPSKHLLQDGDGFLTAEELTKGLKDCDIFANVDDIMQVCVHLCWVCGF